MRDDSVDEKLRVESAASEDFVRFMDENSLAKIP